MIYVGTDGIEVKLVYGMNKAVQETVKANEVHEFNVNDKVETVDTFNGRITHVCNGVVERITKLYVFVRNEHGNLDKYHKDGRTIGYSFPYLMHKIIKK